MPQLCTICTHEKSHEIDLEIIRGKLSNRAIAEHFHVACASLKRHRTDHLADKLRHAQAVAKKIEAINLNHELAVVYQRVRNFFDSCHEHLVDPEDESKYNVGPRADEVTVIYDEPTSDKKKSKRGKARLSSLLKKVEDGLGYTVVGYDIRQADVRALYLEASQQLLEEIHRLGDKLGLFTGHIDQNVLESLRGAVRDMQREFKDVYDLDYTWEEVIDRVIGYYPNRRAYLEKLREEGPESPARVGLLV